MCTQMCLENIIYPSAIDKLVLRIYMIDLDIIFYKRLLFPQSYFYLSLYCKQTHTNYNTSFSLAVTVVVIDIGERDRGGAIQAGELAATPVARHLTRRNTPDLSAINSLAGEGEGEHKKNQKSSHVAKNGRGQSTNPTHVYEKLTPLILN